MKTITIQKILDMGYDLFDFLYSYKDKSLEDRFIEHYYFRDIGFETVEMFKHYLRMEVVRKSPFYNRLLEQVQDLEIELERGRKTITDYKGDNTNLDTLDKTSETIRSNTVETLSEVERTVSNIIDILDEMSSNEGSEYSSKQDTIRDLKESMEALNETLQASTPYSIDSNTFNSPDNATKTKNESSSSQGGNVIVNDEGESQTHNKGENKRTGSEENTTSGTDKVKSETSGKDNLKGQEIKDSKGTQSYTMTVEEIEKPLSQALEEIRNIKTDITYEFIRSLNDLFSLIY